LLKNSKLLAVHGGIAIFRGASREKCMVVRIHFAKPLHEKLHRWRFSENCEKVMDIDKYIISEPVPYIEGIKLK
jgi:hypothetical protein